MREGLRTLAFYFSIVRSLTFEHAALAGRLRGVAGLTRRSAGKGPFTFSTLDGKTDPLLDPKYWEQLYVNGKADPGPNPLADEPTLGMMVRDTTAAPVDVVSVDLDDTLWPGNIVIANANKALDDFLKERYPRVLADGRPNIGTVMRALAAKFPEEFLEDKEDPSSVVRFTDLRKLALSCVAKECGYDDPTEVAEEGFKVWHAGRHDVEHLFYPGALDLLRRLKAKGVKLCAITNGNCDISQIASFRGLLDFCVNAEKVGARKRTGRPYEAAVLQAGCGVTPARRWVHVGDDFTEDIVAPKTEQKMRTIWYRTAEASAEAEAKAEERMKKRRALDEERIPQPAQGERYSRNKNTIQVTSVETDDFLTYSLTRDFADAVAERLEDVLTVIEQWMDEWEQALKQSTNQQEPQAPQAEATPVAAAVEAPSDVATQDTKFCIACGVRIPTRARFCPDCGEKQDGSQL